MYIPLKDRKISAVMATQHPDNAGNPFWHASPFIGDQDEVNELYQCLSNLGNDEYMWDWEGKYADEAMIEKLVSHHHEFFSRKQIGRDFFITLRIPNIWEEKSFKLSRAYMSILSSSEFASSLNLKSPPVFELILPMTTRADQLLYIQDTFRKTAQFKKEVFGDNEFGDGFIHIIPLFESFDNLVESTNLLQEYFDGFESNFGYLPDHVRVFIARSDPAVNSGFVSAGLACKIALRNFAQLEKQTGIALPTIIGCGSLPFRGGFTPENVDEILDLYAGARTLTVQSAFRYDYDMETVKSAIRHVQDELPKTQATEFTDDEIAKLVRIGTVFQSEYRGTIERLSPLINEFAAFIPKRRARVQHIGLFGYNREVGKVQLPRAITFTAALYSMGIPPEFIGTGRALKKLSDQEIALLDKAFPTLRSWLLKSGRMANPENLKYLSKKHEALKEVIEDFASVQEVFGLDLRPKTTGELLHRNLTSNISLKKQSGIPFEVDIVEAAKLRKSIG